MLRNAVCGRARTDISHCLAFHAVGGRLNHTCFWSSARRKKPCVHSAEGETHVMMSDRVRPVNNRTYAVVWSGCLFACGRAVRCFFFTPHVRRRRTCGVKKESLPRCRRRKRRLAHATAYVLSITRATWWGMDRVTSRVNHSRIESVTVQVVSAPAGACGPAQPNETPGGATPLLTTPPERLHSITRR